MKFTSKIFIYCLLLNTFALSKGFLKTQNTKIVNGNGEEVLLRGIGLGGWLLQEGYMIKTSAFANAEHQIRKNIENLIGAAKTDEFYSKYHENFITREDIDSIASWGFNSIRLPMHYNKLTPEDQPYVYTEEGFLTIDTLLSWCKANEIYLILDLHAAPGGQSDEPISDYDPSKPSLWESDLNKQRTVDLWKKLAQRYVDEEWIGGYDLINEPKWNLGANNEPLRELYIQITDAIRDIDTNHIIFIEGNWFATNFTGLTPPWDNNMCYSFHKYWNENSQASIQGYLNLRNYNVPLWNGESGENSNQWFAESIKLMEDNNVGWAWWTHKKIDNIAGPLSAVKLPQYQQLLDYWSGTGSKPSESFAYAALLAQADKLKISQCEFHPDMIDAMFRQVKDNTSVPYKKNNIPGRIYMVNYDMGQNGVAYSDSENQNSTGSPGGQAWNNGGVYRNDGVDIERCSDNFTNGYNVGWIESGEWLKFTVDIEIAGVYSASIRLACANPGGKISLNLEDRALGKLIDVPVTGGWQNWQTVILDNVELPAGRHELSVKFYFGGFNINFIEFFPNTVGIIENKKVPDSFELQQNTPNPFNNSTVIRYSIPEDSIVSLNVYSLTGELVDNLISEFQQSGNYTLNWDTKNINSGVYFYRISTSTGFEKTKKAVLLK
ncbi:MAG: cellulase family glycosylhydrolase [Bacteroidetes bacterium]|nr:cellulase family glycosylhydrolase [Bacteroidota bacterium]